MKSQPKILLLLLFLLALSCGYTEVQRHSRKEITLPTGPLPDLAIAGMKLRTRVDHYSDDPGSYPVTIYNAQVKNIGAASFSGSLMISFTDNWRDVEKKKYPYSGGIGKFKIQPGDSVVITFERGQVHYPPYTRLQFLLRTDSYDPHTFDPVYYFGREPVAEESYENNELDFIVQ